MLAALRCTRNGIVEYTASVVSESSRSSRSSRPTRRHSEVPTDIRQRRQATSYVVRRRSACRRPQPGRQRARSVGRSSDDERALPRTTLAAASLLRRRTRETNRQCSAGSISRPRRPPPCTVGSVSLIYYRLVFLQRLDAFNPAAARRDCDRRSSTERSSCFATHYISVNYLTQPLHCLRRRLDASQHHLAPHQINSRRYASQTTNAIA